MKCAWCGTLRPPRDGRCAGCGAEWAAVRPDERIRAAELLGEADGSLHVEETRSADGQTTVRRVRFSVTRAGGELPAGVARALRAALTRDGLLSGFELPLAFGAFGRSRSWVSASAAPDADRAELRRALEAEAPASGARRPPAGLMLEAHPDRLVLHWTWRAFRNGWIVLFILAWLVLGLRFAPEGALAWLFAAAGVVLGYVALAICVNRTTVRVTPQVLAIAHGPLPWAGGRRLASRSIDQLIVRRHVQRTQRGRRVFYELQARLADGERVSLLRPLSTGVQATFIESEIERYLGIEDRPHWSD